MLGQLATVTVPHSSTLAGFYLVYLHTHGLAAWLLCYKGDSTKFHEMRTGMWDAGFAAPRQDAGADGLGGGV